MIITERDARGLAEALALYRKTENETGVQLTGHDRGYLTLPDGPVVRLCRQEATTTGYVSYVAEIEEG